MGRNPRIQEPPPPRRAYRLTVRGSRHAFHVEPGALPDEDGLPGSILSVLLAHDVALEHACGGVGACGTCHVRVVQGGDSAPEPTDEEDDLLDQVPGVRPDSRLACLCVPDGSEDVEVEIPAWTRHEVREGG